MYDPTMRQRSITVLTYVGGLHRYLRERQEGDFICHPMEEEWGVQYIKSGIDVYITSLDSLGLKVTVRAAGDLKDFRASIEDCEPEATLTEKQAKVLRDTIMSLEKTFTAEAKGIHCFFTTDKQLPMSKLTEEQEKLLPTGVFAELPELAKYDVREAALCVAFERNTAAAYHILRATEDVLRTLYCRAVKRNRIKDLSWWGIVNDFPKRHKKPKGALLKSLDYIRENFRNPTAHPEARYNSDEAQALYFGVSLAANTTIRIPIGAINASAGNIMVDVGTTNGITFTLNGTERKVT